MLLSKRGGGSVLSILGSLQGTPWKLLENFPVEDVEKEDAYDRIIAVLDKHFAHDDRVQVAE